jgi:hypothetical protein
MEFIENADANYVLKVDKIVLLLQNIGRKYSVFMKLEGLDLSWKIDRSAWKVELFVGSTMVNAHEIRHRDIGATQLMLLANLVGKMWDWQIKEIDVGKFVCDNPQAAYYLLLAETSLNRNGNNYFALVETLKVHESPISFTFEFVDRVPRDLSFNNPSSPMTTQTIPPLLDKDIIMRSQSNGHIEKKRVLEDFIHTGHVGGDLLKSLPYSIPSSFYPPTSSNSSSSHSNPFKMNYHDVYDEPAPTFDNSRYMSILNELQQKQKVHMTIISESKSGPEHAPLFTIYASINVKLNNGHIEEVVVAGSSPQRRNAIFEALYSFFNYNKIGIQLLKNPNVV